MISMHPLQYKTEDFENLINKLVRLNYSYKKGGNVEIICIIKQIYLSSNSPHLPVDIELLCRNDSFALLKKSNIPIPQRICITDISSIELITD